MKEEGQKLIVAWVGFRINRMQVVSTCSSVFLGLLMWYTADKPDIAHDPFSAATGAYNLHYQMDGFIPSPLVCFLSNMCCSSENAMCIEVSYQTSRIGLMYGEWRWWIGRMRDLVMWNIPQVFGMSLPCTAYFG